MKNLLSFAAVCLLLSTLSLQISTVFAQTTAFTYQGRLNDGANPATGIYDLRFAIFDAASGGTQQGMLITNSPTGVTNGLFTVTLDFGNQFSGADRWLEIAVRTNGAVVFTLLDPRQALTPTPYAIMAGNASNVTGVVSSANVSGTYSGAVTFNNVGNNFSGSFVGNGANVTNVNAATLGGLGASSFWQLGGNSTTAGQFLGSTNNQPLEIKAGGLRVLRLEFNTLTNGAPNVIGGSPVNLVGAGVVGATIGGGGATNYFGSPYANTIASDYGSIGGGLANHIDLSSTCATIAGGQVNGIGTNSNYSAIGGGGANNIAGFSLYASIAGGFVNNIGTNDNNGSIGGGYDNNIADRSYNSTIAGGYQNNIGQDAFDSTIGGGYDNNISNYSPYATIGGGQNNLVSGSAGFGTIGGGNANHILVGDYSVVAGGNGNEIAANAANTRGSVVSGGENNTNSGTSSVIAGGSLNVIVPQGVYVVSETIGGGFFNSIGYTTRFGGAGTTTDSQRTIAGGGGNYILAGAGAGTISGGFNNTVVRNGQFGTVPGGRENQAGDYSFAAGYRALATNSGSFVWSDSSGSGLNSTAANQFLIRAAGGVGINTNNPGATLDVNGTLRVGAGTTIFKNLQGGIAQMASGSSTVKTNFTFNFPKAFSNVPTVVISANSGNVVPVDDTFAVTVRAVTTTSCTVNVVRVDNPSGWSQQVKINWIAWE